MKNWTGWKNKEYPDCDHCFTDWTSSYEVINNCITALDEMVLERYPDKNDGPHAGFYYQGKADGVPIMPCGGVVKCSLRMWGELMANIASKRDGEYYSYMDFAWI
jgi:hypothetical protein